MAEHQPERIFCTAGECLEEAVVVGRATIQVSPLVGAAESDPEPRLRPPLCAHHAHLLRFDNEFVAFDNGTRSATGLAHGLGHCAEKRTAGTRSRLFG